MFGDYFKMEPWEVVNERNNVFIQHMKVMNEFKSFTMYRQKWKCEYVEGRIGRLI